MFRDYTRQVSFPIAVKSMLNKLAWVIVVVLLWPHSSATAAPQCLFISSYHVGYDWSDGVERGLRKALDGKCTITSFNMDAKRNTTVEHARQAALQAKALIEQLRPDVVIAADDVAAKYVIVPYYKDAAIPFVFCGINWTVEQYGFPFNNVTGMIEVAAVQPLFEKSNAIAGKIHHATYIGADTLTEAKNLDRFKQAAKELNIEITGKLSKTAREWIKSYKDAQKTQLIIMGSNAGITNWDEETVLNAIRPYTKTLTVTNHGWMMPYTMFGMTKVPEEQGEWAGMLAVEILRGTKPIELPVIPNRKFDIVINKSLLETANITIPEFIKLKAQTYRK
jgi:ABC-type uncharacterized transport system substrate-binding protein